MAKIIKELRDFILKGKGIQVSAKVPGDILDDLLRGGAIEAFDRDADYEKIQWVQESDWEYETTFNLTVEELKKYVSLKFYGIDTFSEVFLNGISLGKTEDMFLMYEYALNNCAKVGENTLRVVMESPMSRLRSKVNDKYVCIFNNDRLYWRKAQCHFGWDWAPEVAGYGIYEPVQVVVSDGFTIEDLTIRTRLNGKITVFAELGYNVFTEFAQYQGRDVLELRIRDHKSGEEVASRCFTVNRKKNLINIDIPNPKLWWPNTYGDPNLYDLSVTLMRDGEVLDQKTEVFGIRSVQIKEEPIGDENRLTYRININGKDVYCKGSNWVPLDFRTGIIADEQYRKSLVLAKNANFNMLRVWGGGIYEKDAFYRYCDENGIMVMQEFMISCSDVPEDEPGFAELLSREAEYQVKRLKNKTCIVMWSGGNERATAFSVLKEDRNSFVSDYVFRGIVNKYVYGIPYVDHSPWSYTDVDDDEMSGDSHWSCMDKSVAKNDVGNYRDYLNWKITAFTAECAALGPTRLRDTKKFISEQNLWPINSVWEKRFRCNPADSKCINFVYWAKMAATQLFGEPDGVEDFIKKGMIAQYELLLDEILFQRVNRQYNGGFLNWMFGDIWGTGTWSVIDYWFEPKGGYYGMQRAFKNFVLGFVKDIGGTYKLGIINDTGDLKSGIIKYGAKDMDGREIAAYTMEINVQAYSTIKLAISSDLNKDGYWFAEFGGKTVSYFPNYWKGKQWHSDFSYSVTPIKGGVSLCIEAKSFLRKVFVSVPEGKEVLFEDNFFDVQPGEEKVVKIYGDDLSAKDIVLKTFADDWNE